MQLIQVEPPGGQIQKVTPSGGQICNFCKWCHLVSKFATYESDGDGDEGDANNEVMILAAE